jgi:hypothetical protein
MFRNRSVIAATLALAALLAFATATLAAPPIRTTQHVDVTFPLPTELCGVPVDQHLQGTVRQTIFVDQNGEPVRILDSVASLTITLINPSNGASVTTVGSASGHVTLHSDGSATLAITGLQGHLKSPDGGFVGTDVGRLVLHFPVEGAPEILQQAGQFAGGPFPTVCDLLA